jgi:uncharacterized membrane-anchored protein
VEARVVTRRQVLGLWGGLVLVLGVVDFSAAGRERLLRAGTRVLLPLAPVDPRSLMQGDYMRLRYALESDVRAALPTDADDAGTLVLRVDADGVGHLARLAAPGEAPGPGEVLLRYRSTERRIAVGPDAFFFQEGDADRFARAAFADLRVSPDGDVVLHGLCDRERRALGAP